MSNLVECLRAFEGSDDLGNGDFSVCTQAADRLEKLEKEVALLKLDVATQECLQDSSYRAGMKFGWNCCIAGAGDRYAQVMKSTEHVAALQQIAIARKALEE